VPEARARTHEPSGAQAGTSAGRAAAGSGVAAGSDAAAVPARVRREPRQARSRARVAQILASADAILSVEGFEALTVRRIAQEAGVPVGSIYQFFPDKAAVIDALAHGYIGEFDAAIAGLVAGAQAAGPDGSAAAAAVPAADADSGAEADSGADAVAGGAGDWSDPVARLVDEFADLYRSRPGYVALWSGRHLSPELARADEANNLAIAAGVRRILVARGILTDGPDLERNSQVAVRVADALLQFAFSSAAGGDEGILQELKTMLRLYLADLATR
jgi:AcrR family transcriptional regulator